MERTLRKGGNPNCTETQQLDPNEKNEISQVTFNLSIESEWLTNGQRDNDDYALVSKLTELSCNLTKDLFVNQLITDYNAELEDIRLRLYEAVKASTDYPYDPTVDLKRRKNAYGGENKLQKLAKDIYVLVQVLEGSEFQEMRELLSLPSTRNTNLDSSILSTNVKNNAEIDALKTLVSDMKADIMTLKEHYSEMKNEISEEIKEIKISVQKVKIELQMDVSDLRDEVFTNAQSISRIVDEKSNGNAALKTDIKLIKNDLKEISDVMSTKADVKRIESANEKHAQLIKRVSKLEKSKKDSTQHSPSRTISCGESNPVIVSDSQRPSASASPVANQCESTENKSYAEVVQIDPDQNMKNSESTHSANESHQSGDTSQKTTENSYFRNELSDDVHIPFNRVNSFRQDRDFSSNNATNRDRPTRKNIARQRLKHYKQAT